MAASFAYPAHVSTDRTAFTARTSAGAPAGRPVGRPTLVVLDGGRSSSAQRRRRMYLQRRIAAAFVALLLLVVALAATAAALLGGAPASSSEVPVASSLEVAPGDTLWSIAGRLDLDADRRQVVALLADANGGSVIRPGQRLVIPASVLALG